MPEAVEACVRSLMAKWRADPSSRPTPRKGKDGEPQKAKQQAWAICQAARKAEANMICLEGVGPAILGAAVTNRPHIKGLPPISILDIEGGTKIIRVPLLKKGRFKHRTGLLIFDDDVFSKMIANFDANVVGNDLTLDNRHKPEEGANGWFKKVFVLDDILTADVAPTPAGLRSAEERRYKYASIEFHPNWEDSQVAACSAESLQEIREENIMPDTDVLTLEEQLEQAQEALRLEQERVAVLKQEQIAMGEEAVVLESRLVALEQAAFKGFVESICLAAEHYRDSDGKAHAKVFLDFLRSVLAEEPIGETIKLEDREDPGQARAYYRRALAWLAQNLPGTVPLEAAGTEPDSTRSLSDDSVSKEDIDADAKSLWEE